MNTSARSKPFWATAAQIKAVPLGFVLLLLPFCSSAQQNKLVVSPPNPLTVKRGSTAVQTLEVDVLPGFHVNNDHPRDEFLIPLSLKWDGGPIKATGFHFPKPEEIQVGADHLLVFTGKFDVKTDFAVDANAPVGSTTITGKLRYQACSNQMCFRPASLEIKLPVTVE